LGTKEKKKGKETTQIKKKGKKKKHLRHALQPFFWEGGKRVKAWGPKGGGKKEKKETSHGPNRRGAGRRNHPNKCGGNRSKKKGEKSSNHPAKYNSKKSRDKS